MPYYKDIKNKKFGSWTVLTISSRRDTSQRAYWDCRCVCGKVKEVLGTHLWNDRSTNCGCLRSSKTTIQNLTHGLSKTRFYNIWAGMIKRCDNPNASRYKFYGAKGIKVSKAWHNFQNFMIDMRLDYQIHVALHGEKNTTLERKDPRQGYKLSNCVWATWEIQHKNTLKQYAN